MNNLPVRFSKEQPNDNSSYARKVKINGDVICWKRIDATQKMNIDAGMECVLHKNSFLTARWIVSIGQMKCNLRRVRNVLGKVSVKSAMIIFVFLVSVHLLRDNVLLK